MDACVATSLCRSAQARRLTARLCRCVHMLRRFTYEQMSERKLCMYAYKHIRICIYIYTYAHARRRRTYEEMSALRLWDRRIGIVLSQTLAAKDKSGSEGTLRFVRRACPQDTDARPDDGAGRSRRALAPGDVVAASSLQELMGAVLPAAMAATSPRQTRAYMIGGGALATEMLEAGLIDEFVLSLVEGEFEGDVYFHEHELRCRFFSDVEVLRSETEFQVRRYYTRRCPPGPRSARGDSDDSEAPRCGG